jgi:hypothetical protein
MSTIHVRGLATETQATPDPTSGDPTSGDPTSGDQVSDPVTGDQDPFGQQRKLAASLIKNLGYEDAVDACRRNGWCGVLKVLLEAKPGTA